jgi:hypothetical protein
MTHARRPILLACALLALTLTPAAVSAQQPVGPPVTQPPPQRPSDGAGDQGRIQMPRRAGSLGPARDRAAAPEVGTGRIRGRVVDDSGQALRRVIVRTFSTQSQGFGGRQPRMATTDAEGRYELSELPAGTYQVIATKGAFVQQSYGQRSRNGPGRPIELADGQSVDKIDFVLSRGGVIVGRVVDELGEPMAEVFVQAMRFVSTSGAPRLVPMGRNASTDDLGQFRVYGLPPGEYVLSAHLRNNMFERAERPAGSDNSGYAPTYAPNTTNAAEATRIQVQSGQEMNADVQLTAARMLRVSGTVVTSQGKAPEFGMIRLVPKGDSMVGQMMGLDAAMQNGSFSFNQVPPGSYTLTVRIGDGPGRFRRGGDGPDETEFAMLPITVAGDDLANVRVVTGRGLTVAGVVTSEGGPLPTDQTLRVMVAPAEPDGMMMMVTRPAEVETSGRFQVEGVIGEGRVNLMGLGRGWMLKAVEYKGANVTDKPVEFASDGGPLRIVVTNRIPILSGTVTSGNGAPLTDYEVLIFTTDTSAWERPGRQVRVARADQQGGFKVEGLPAGDYHVAAFSSLEEDSRTSPETLARARSVAQQVTLVEGQTKSVSLRLATLPSQ